MESFNHRLSRLFPAIVKESLFLVWASPTLGSQRSRMFSAEAGLCPPEYIYAQMNRGGLTAPLRYIYQGVKTLQMLFRRRPRVVFVQSPPSVAVWFVYLYCLITRSQYLIDAHSLALQSPVWTRPTWLQRILVRRAVAVIVTDEYFQPQVEAWGGRAFILKDPVTQYPQEKVQLNGHFSVTVVNSFKEDEPIHEMLAAASSLPDVKFYVTGNTKKADPQVLESAPANVSFTGYLSTERYYGLLTASDVVMCLSLRDHTLQCGACEALSLEKPVITSSWPMLRDYFYQGTVHVPNTPEGIRLGVIEMKQNLPTYQAGIVALRQKHRQDWEKKVEELFRLIQNSKK